MLLYERIKSLHPRVSKIVYYTEPPSVDFYSVNEIKDLMLDSDFTSLEIKDEIEKYVYYYFIKVNKNRYIHLLLRRVITPVWKREIMGVIKEILIFQSVFETQRDVKVILIPTLKKKLMPKKKSVIIGTNHVNSGSTFFWGPLERVILIWRKEELSKVLLHELVHYHKLDKLILKRDYQEAYTETLANVLYQTITAVEKKQSLKKLRQRLKDEQEYSKYQLANLVRYWYPVGFPSLTVKSRILM